MDRPLNVLLRKLDKTMGFIIQPGVADRSDMPDEEKIELYASNSVRAVSLVGLALLNRRNNYVRSLSEAAVEVLTEPSFESDTRFQSLLFAHCRDFFPQVFPVQFATKDVIPLYIRKYLELLKSIADRRGDGKEQARDESIDPALGELLTFFVNNWTGTVAILRPSAKTPEGPSVEPLPGAPAVSGRVNSLSHQIKPGLYLLSQHNEPISLHPFFYFQENTGYCFRMVTEDGLFYRMLGKSGFSVISDQELLMSVGNALFRLGGFKEAIHPFGVLEGENREAFIMVSSLNHCINAETLMKKGASLRAAAEWELALAVRPDVPILYHKTAWAYTAANRYSQAVGILNRLLERFPISDEAYAALGDVYMAKGDRGRAQRAFEKVLILNPSHERAARKKEHLKVLLSKQPDREDEKSEKLPEEVLFNLTRKAMSEPRAPLIGRDAYLDRLMEILSCKDKKNALIVGDAGVGKTALVEELAVRIQDESAPEGLRQRDVTSLNMAALIAGARYRGQFEERVLEVIRKVKKLSPILLVENIHHLVATGSSRGASLDSANLLKPALLNGDVQVIGTTNEDSLSNVLEKDPAFLKLFHLLRLEELDLAKVREIVRDRIPTYEDFHGVSFPESLVEDHLEIVRLSLSTTALPESALDLVDRTASRVSVEMSRGERNDANVSRRDILETLSEMSGISYERLSLLDRSHLDRMEGFLAEEIVGQEEAVGKVASLVKTAKLGLDLQARRPDGVFLFVGPTGVGKTELARSVAKFLFGDEEKLIRIDMSEYMERISGSRLIGTAPGYVGYYDQNQLTDQVRKNPYSVVLFDEVEKADSQILNLLLQIFDAGRLTDGKGRTVRFHDTTIIMTSNVGTKLLSKSSVGYGDTEGEISRNLIMKEVRSTFTPEFLNRIDEIVVFDSLSTDSVARIVELQLAELIVRLERQGKSFILEPEARSALAVEGYSREYGARNLGRILRRRISEPLAELALEPSWENSKGVRVYQEDGEVRVELVLSEEGMKLDAESALGEDEGERCGS